MPKETIHFKLTWDEEEEASLVYLINNKTVILDPDNKQDDRVGRGLSDPLI